MFIRTIRRAKIRAQEETRMKTLILFTLAAAMARGCASDYSYTSSASHVWTPPGEDPWQRDSLPPAQTLPAAPVIAQAPLIPPVQPPPVQPAPAVRLPEPRKLEPSAPVIPEPAHVELAPAQPPKPMALEMPPKIEIPAPTPRPEPVVVTAPQPQPQPPHIELPP